VDFSHPGLQECGRQCARRCAGCHDVIDEGHRFAVPWLSYPEGVINIQCSLAVAETRLNGRVSDPLDATAVEFDPGRSLDGFSNQHRLIVTTPKKATPGQRYWDQGSG